MTFSYQARRKMMICYFHKTKTASAVHSFSSHSSCYQCSYYSIVLFIYGLCHQCSFYRPGGSLALQYTACLRCYQGFYYSIVQFTYSLCYQCKLPTVSAIRAPSTDQGAVCLINTPLVSLQQLLLGLLLQTREQFVVTVYHWSPYSSCQQGYYCKQGSSLSLQYTTCLPKVPFIMAPTADQGTLCLYSTLLVFLKYLLLWLLLQIRGHFVSTVHYLSPYSCCCQVRLLHRPWESLSLQYTPIVSLQKVYIQQLLCGILHRPGDCLTPQQCSGSMTFWCGSGSCYFRH